MRGSPNIRQNHSVLGHLKRCVTGSKVPSAHWMAVHRCSILKSAPTSLPLLPYLLSVRSARGCPRFSSMQPPHGAAQESGFTPLCLLATYNTTGFVLNFSLELVFHITRRLGIGKYYRRTGVLKRPGGGEPPFRNPALQSNAGSS